MSYAFMLLLAIAPGASDTTITACRVSGWRGICRDARCTPVWPRFAAVGGSQPPLPCVEPAASGGFLTSNTTLLTAAQPDNNTLIAAIHDFDALLTARLALPYDPDNTPLAACISANNLSAYVARQLNLDPGSTSVATLAADLPWTRSVTG